MRTESQEEGAGCFGSALGGTQSGWGRGIGGAEVAREGGKAFVSK